MAALFCILLLHRPILSGFGPVGQNTRWGNQICRHTGRLQPHQKRNVTSNITLCMKYLSYHNHLSSLADFYVEKDETCKNGRCNLSFICIILQNNEETTDHVLHAFSKACSKPLHTCWVTEPLDKKKEEYQQHSPSPEKKKSFFQPIEYCMICAYFFNNTIFSFLTFSFIRFTFGIRMYNVVGIWKSMGKAGGEVD